MGRRATVNLGWRAFEANEITHSGAHYLLTVKNNQPTLRQNIDQIVPVPPTGFSPSEVDPHPGANPRKK